MIYEWLKNAAALVGLVMGGKQAWDTFVKERPKIALRQGASEYAGGIRSPLLRIENPYSHPIIIERVTCEPAVYFAAKDDETLSIIRGLVGKELEHVVPASEHCDLFLSQPKTHADPSTSLLVKAFRRSTKRSILPTRALRLRITLKDVEAYRTPDPNPGPRIRVLT